MLPLYESMVMKTFDGINVTIISKGSGDLSTITGTLWSETSEPPRTVVVKVVGGTSPLPRLPPIDEPRNRAERRARKKWR